MEMSQFIERTYSRGSSGTFWAPFIPRWASTSWFVLALFCYMVGPGTPFFFWRVTNSRLIFSRQLLNVYFPRRFAPFLWPRESPMQQCSLCKVTIEIVPLQRFSFNFTNRTRKMISDEFEKPSQIRKIFSS